VLGTLPGEGKKVLVNPPEKRPLLGMEMKVPLSGVFGCGEKSKFVSTMPVKVSEDPFTVICPVASSSL
jgi:hypothetical protein